MIRKAGFRGLWYPFTAEECRAYVGDIKRDGEIIMMGMSHWITLIIELCPFFV